MSVEFKHSRLFVGWRRRDWRKVWYAPCIAENDDGEEVDPSGEGTIPMKLFKFATGDPKQREPMEAEVVFLAHFQTDKGDADGKDGKKAREAMQMQFIYDAWTYLNERDAVRAAQLEQQMDNPDYRKWQSWFNEAKIFKRRQIHGLAARRVSRARAAQDAAAATGLTLQELDYNSDTSASGEDSGFESEDERRLLVIRSRNNRASTGSNPNGPRMPPPPRPNKRGASDNGNSGPAIKKYKGPQKPRGRAKRLSPPRMSGAASGPGLGRRISEQLLDLGKDTSDSNDGDNESNPVDDDNNSSFDPTPSDHSSRTGPGSSRRPNNATTPQPRVSAHLDMSEVENTRNHMLNGTATNELDAINQAIRESTAEPEDLNGGD